MFMAGQVREWSLSRFSSTCIPPRKLLVKSAVNLDIKKPDSAIAKTGTYSRFS
jgi:hypothetical protein